MNRMDGLQAEATRPDGKYDLAGRVIGLAMKVLPALGPGFVEPVYERAQQHELTKAGIAFAAQVALKVHDDNVIVDDFVADLLAGKSLLAELKAVQALAATHEVQPVNYLTATGIEQGLLLSFGASRLKFRRKFRTYRPPAPHSCHSVHSVQPLPA
ncbi:MAG TPA: GxxExxY protein [Verrucomicrobiota bacterium]|nr:GxxExxY protein [Verrucomicrobiota bacterium]